MKKNLLLCMITMMIFGFTDGRVAAEVRYPERIAASGDLPVLLKNMPPLKLDKELEWKKTGTHNLPSSGFDWGKRGRYDKYAVNVVLFGNDCQQETLKDTLCLMPLDRFQQFFKINQCFLKYNNSAQFFTPESFTFNVKFYSSAGSGTLEGEGLEGMHTNIGSWKEAGKAAIYALKVPSAVYAGSFDVKKGEASIAEGMPAEDRRILETPKVLLHNYPYSDKKSSATKRLFPEKKIDVSLVKNPIKVGEEFVLHGNVSPNSSVAGEEIIIEVFEGFPSLMSLFSAGERLIKTNLDEDGHFMLRSAVDKPGRYTLFARMIDPTTKQQVASQAIELYVTPHVGAVSLLYFRDSMVIVSEEGKDVLPLLIAQGKAEDWEVSSPALFGTYYSFEDPSMARVTAEGFIEGIKPGRTVMHANFRGQKASIPVLITPKLVPPQESIVRLKQPIQPQTPVPLNPVWGSVFSKGEKITLRVTSFDSSMGDVMSSSFWQVREAGGKRIVADLRIGTENYAEWIPPRSGVFEWSMSYFHSRGRTKETPWVKIIVQD